MVLRIRELVVLASRPETPNHLAQTILTSRSALKGERKTITALFADIKGSMELIEGVDPEEARRIVDPAPQLMIDAVHGTRATSRSRPATESSPSSARRSRTKIMPARTLRGAQDAGGCQEVRRRAQTGRGVVIQARVGLNSGEIVVRSIRKDDL